MRAWRLEASILGCGLLVACGGAPPETEHAKTPPSPRPAPAQQPETDLEPPIPPTEPASADSGALQDAERTKLESQPEERKIIYRVTPGGLVVDLEGVRFTPKASVKKLPNGGFGLELEVVAEVTDDRSRTLLNPALGALSLAAKIYDKNGEERARHGDRREGSDQQFLMPGAPQTLTRSWPSGELKGPLWWGQKLELQVGLWGLGVDADPGRPVKKLFVVEMVAGAKTRAVITPPEVNTGAK